MHHDKKTDVDIRINIFLFPMYKAYMREYMSKSSILSIWTFASEAPGKNTQVKAQTSNWGTP